MADSIKPIWDRLNKHSNLIAEVDKKTDMNTIRIEQQEARHGLLMQQVVKSEGKIDAKQDALLTAVSSVQGQIRTLMWGVPLTLTLVSVVAGATYAISKSILGG